MKRFLICLLTLFLIIGCTSQADCQSVDPLAGEPSLAAGPDVVEAGSDSFHRGVIRAAMQLRERGELSRREVLRLRVAMLSPAFRAKAKELAIVQMTFSGEESAQAPIGSDGTIDQAAIDWDGLADFIERLIPLILQLLEIFAQLGMDLHDPTVMQAAIDIACHLALAA